MTTNLVSRITTKIKSSMGQSPAHKPQSYKTIFNFEVINNSSELAKFFLVSPLPLKKYHGNILDKLIIETAGNIFTEEQCGNQYIYWALKLKPFEKRSISYQFQISTSPVNISINPNFTITDYSFDHQDLIWLTSNRHLHPDSLEIVKITRSIIKDDKNILSIVIKICEFIKQNLVYGNPIAGLYSDLQSLQGNAVDCGGFSTLFVSLCQNLGIPARIISGFWTDRPGREMHAWAEFMLPDKTWVPVDLSIEWLKKAGKENKLAKLGYLGSDRIACSYGNDLTILKFTPQETNVDILQVPFVVPANPKIKLDYSVSSITQT